MDEAVPRAMVAEFHRANVLKRRRSLVGRRLVKSSRSLESCQIRSPFSIAMAANL